MDAFLVAEQSSIFCVERGSDQSKDSKILHVYRRCSHQKADDGSPSSTSDFPVSTTSCTLHSRLVLEGDILLESMGKRVGCLLWWIYVALCSSTLVSPTDGFHSHRRASHYRYHRGSTKRMVLTTPESIIEQASTTNLLDDLIDESVRTSARKPIMMQFDPSSGWIWKRWKGTIFSETWDACVTKMLYACAIFLVCRSFPQVKKSLSGFNILC